MPIEEIFNHETSLEEKFKKLMPYQNKRLLLFSIAGVEEDFYIIGKLIKLVDGELPIMELELCETDIPYAPNTKVRTYFLGDVISSYSLPKIKSRGSKESS